MTADLSALIARLEAAEAGDQDLSLEVNIALEGGEPVGKTANYVMEPYWAIRRPNPAYLGGFENGPNYPVTTSLDAALALAERVLPGWHVGIQPWFHTDPDRVMSRAYLIRPDWKRWNPVGDEWCEQHHGRSCATPALAVAAATLRAKLDGYAAEGEVNKNPKAQEG